MTRKSRTIYPWILLYAIPELFPVLYLALTGGTDETALWNARRGGLLLNSMRVALPVVLLCAIISVFASVRIHAAGKKHPVLRWFFLLTAPVPSYIYALSYMNLARWIGKLLGSSGTVYMMGIGPCIIVETLSFLPFACAAALMGLDQADADEWNAALLMQNADRTFRHVIFPRQMPYVLAMSAIIFVLSITDYSIPSLFQVNVYAMEIFSDYSATGKSVHSLRLSLPLVLIAAVVIGLSFARVRKVTSPMRSGREVRPQYSGFMKMTGNLCSGITILQIALPVLSLLPWAGDLAREFVSAGKELWYSCISGILAAVFSAVLSAGIALILAGDEGIRRRRKIPKSVRILCWCIAVLPLALPGVLTGISVLKLVSDSPFYAIRSGSLMPALGLTAHYLPFSALIQFGCYVRLDEGKLRAAYLMEPGKGKAFLHVKLPMMVPGLIISGIVVFLLSLGDVGTSLMLMPPGKEPLSVKIYNYLHYGSSETVAVFCLLQAIVCLAVMGLVFLTAAHMGKHKVKGKSHA